jgi:uncharacterized membrane protein YkvA (DUF1232 family)
MAAEQSAGRGWQMVELVRKGIVRAEELVRNPRELLRLLDLAERRLDKLEAGRFNPMKEDLQSLLRMMRAYGDGRYREVSGKNIALAGLGLLYLVSPLDILPDFLPGGFADDAAVIGFIVKKLRREIVAFETWERSQGSQEGWR